MLTCQCYMLIHSTPSKNQITNAFNYSFNNLSNKHISIWNESVEMRGLEQSKAIETGIIFLSKIDKIIPNSIKPNYFKKQHSSSSLLLT